METDNSWYFLKHAGGAPVRCAKECGKLQCASRDGDSCMWGAIDKFGYDSYQLITENVDFSATYTVDCPGWTADDGSNACVALNCLCDDTGKL